MKILITGGCGFIGSHIVDRYVDEGHDVVVLDNLSTGDIKNLNPQAAFYEEDICDEKIEKIFQREKFDTINHLAAQINVRTSVDDPRFDTRVNVIGTVNLLSLGAKYGIQRFIFASSGGAIYGEPEQLPITENFPLNPLSPYAVAKMAAERYIVTFANMYAFHYTILRYSNVYGPRQISKSEAGVISIFINQILDSKECTVFGDGHQIRDYVYVHDVAEANVRALDCRSDMFNIGTGVATSVNDLIDMLSDIARKKIDHKHSTPRPGEVFKNVLDCSKAASLLQWKPTTLLRQGLHETFEYFQ
jgi:UDP-glucose 4-epimerase